MASYQENVPIRKPMRSVPVFKNISYLPIPMPVTDSGLHNVIPEREEKLSWLLRATNWLGITMAKTESPQGGNWSFNPATITLTLFIAGGILTGGYLWGENVTERRHMMERLQKAEDDARRAKDLSISAASSAGHQTNTNTKPEDHR